MRRIINWLKNHKPLDWKYIIILLLLLSTIKRDLIFFVFFLIGFASYPNEINYVPIFERAGDKIANIYTSVMTKLYEHGFDLGEVLYPHNDWIAAIITYGITFILIILLICLMIWIINVMMYSFKKK